MSRPVPSKIRVASLRSRGSSFGSRSQRIREKSTRRAEREPQVRDATKRDEQLWATYDIFEGTEQIQQLVVARAISGMRIE
jgi:hypothetical protein